MGVTLINGDERHAATLLLMQNPANLQTLDNEGFTYLHLAARYQRIEVARCLLNSHVSPNSLNHLGETALHIAARQGNLKMISLLLEHGARYDLPNRHGQIPEQIAWQYGNEAASLMLRNQRLIQSTVASEEERLRYAAIEGMLSQQQQTIDQFVSTADQSVETTIRDIPDDWSRFFRRIPIMICTGVLTWLLFYQPIHNAIHGSYQCN